MISIPVFKIVKTAGGYKTYRNVPFIDANFVITEPSPFGVQIQTKNYLTILEQGHWKAINREKLIDDLFNLPKQIPFFINEVGKVWKYGWVSSILSKPKDNRTVRLIFGRVFWEFEFWPDSSTMLVARNVVPETTGECTAMVAPTVSGVVTSFAAFHPMISFLSPQMVCKSLVKTSMEAGLDWLSSPMPANMIQKKPPRLILNVRRTSPEIIPSTS